MSEHPQEQNHIRVEGGAALFVTIQTGLYLQKDDKTVAVANFYPELLDYVDVYKRQPVSLPQVLKIEAAVGHAHLQQKGTRGDEAGDVAGVQPLIQPRQNLRTAEVAPVDSEPVSYTHLIFGIRRTTYKSV